MLAEIETPPREACPRIKAAKIGPDGVTRFKPWIPEKWIATLEQNQMLASCCRHPENHDVAAYYSSARDEAAGVPDIYIFFCSCGRRHTRFCAGGTKGLKVDHLGEFVRDENGDVVLLEVKRPFWEVR